MFGSIGMPELLIIFVIALIIFGPRKLPELGRSLGKSLGEFKRASNDLRNTLEDEIRIEEKAVPSSTSKSVEPMSPTTAPPPTESNTGEGLLENELRMEEERTSRSTSPSVEPAPQTTSPPPTEPNTGEGLVKDELRTEEERKVQTATPPQTESDTGA